MNKLEFLSKLKTLLASGNEVETDKTIKYYDEILSDLIEDGISESDAVLKLGNINDIVDEILSDKENKNQSYDKLDNRKTIVNNTYVKRSKSSSTLIFAILLFVFGFPIWLPLVIIAFTVLLVIFILCLIPFIVIFAIIASLFSGVGGIVTIFGFRGGGMFDLGLGLVMVGFVVLLMPYYKKIFTYFKNKFISLFNYIRRLLGGIA